MHGLVPRSWAIRWIFTCTTRRACRPQACGSCSAEEILPRAVLFTHRRTGSLGSFSDWFRYRLLKERGGIWADTDVVCLAPLVYPQQEIFGWQDARVLNNAVLGLPAGHPLGGVA